MADNKISTTSAMALRQYLVKALQDYFLHLDGARPIDLYNMVLTEIEMPLLQSVMEYAAGNQTKASAILGISRGTLRKKLRQYQLCLD